MPEACTVCSSSPVGVGRLQTDRRPCPTTAAKTFKSFRIGPYSQKASWNSLPQVVQRPPLFLVRLWRSDARPS
jgi:hypothetical protein